MAGRRMTGGAGVAAALMFLIGIFLIKLPGGPDTDPDVVRWLGDHGNRTRQYVGGYLWAFAAIALLLFVIGLAHWLWELRSSDGFVVLARLGGAAAAALLLAAASGVIAMVSTISIQHGGHPTQQAATIGWIAVTLALVAFPFALATVMLAVAGTDAVPGWLRLLSLLSAVAMLVALTFFPLVFLVGWLLAAGAVLLRSEPVAPGRTAPVTT